MSKYVQLELDFNSRFENSNRNSCIESEYQYHGCAPASKPIYHYSRIQSVLLENPLIEKVQLIPSPQREKIIIQIRSKNRIMHLRTSLKILNAQNEELMKIADSIVSKRWDKVSRELFHKYSLYALCHKAIHSRSATGRFYQLSELFESLNQQYFSNRLDNPVVWTKRYERNKRKRRLPKAVRLGYFCKGCSSIFINSLLDNPNISPDLIEIIIFHEMIHAYLFEYGPSTIRPHGKEFKEIYFRHPKSKTIEKEISSGNFIAKLFHSGKNHT